MKPASPRPVTTNLGAILGPRADSSDLALIAVDPAGAEREYACRDIERGSLAVVARLKEHRLPPGSRVGIFADNSAHYLMAYLGIMRAGLVCVPVNIRQPRDIVEFICRDADIRLGFADTSGAALLGDSLPTLDLYEVEMWEPDSPAPGDDSPVDPAATALILYTSGSTGRPKGVVLSHASQLAMVKNITGGTDSELFAGQCGIVVAPMFHMNALVFLKSFLAGGGFIVLLAKFDSTVFARAVMEHRVNVITGVPTMIAMLHRDWDQLGQLGITNFSSVHTVYIGSAPVTDAIVNLSRVMMPQARILNSYGTTETGGGLFGPHPEGLDRPATAVGYPVANVGIRLAANTGTEAGSDADVGILHVKAHSAMAGYLNLPELTATKVRDGWIDTGDLFRRDENGFFFYVGRADDMFVCSGENIYPGEVEKAIESHPDVIQACVIPVTDTLRGHMPVAFVVARNAQLNEKAVQEHVRSRAAPYLYPRRVWFVDALPLASTTKIDRRSLMLRAENLMAAEQQAAATP